MRRQLLIKSIRIPCLIAVAVIFTSAPPLMALPPGPPCEPGEFTVGEAISVQLTGPTAPFEIWLPATFTATAADDDYCPKNYTVPEDTVDKFTWYVDDELYPEGNNLSQITLTFDTAGLHTVRVVADDHPDYADDASVQRQVTVSVLDPDYDKTGNRRKTTDSRGVTRYEYDVLGRLTKIIDTDGRWIAYEYDSASNRTKMTTHSGTPSFNHVTQYQYNDRGLLSKVTDQLNNGETTYTYKDNGLVDTITYPNGTKAIHSYNSRNWLTSISNQKTDENNTVIAKFTYTYDPTYWGKNGTRTQVIENILKPNGDRIKAQVDYEYDDLYRLVHEHRIADGGGDAGVTYEYNFAYDAAGNRTAWQVVGGNTTYYHHDGANKLLDYGSSNTPPYTGNATVAYDGKGNTTQIVSGTVTTTYTWDYLNRMTEWAKTNETTQDYVYNADGMRVRKTPSGGTATDFLLDGTMVAEEVTGNSDISYILPGVICQISDSTRTVYHMDGLGSTRGMSDGSEGVVESAVYDAYGNTLLTSGSVPRFGFAGQYRYFTDATGLQYLKARYYDPGIGRFTSRDPIKYDMNWYAYVENRPVLMVDPTGNIPAALLIPVLGCAGGALAGAIIAPFIVPDEGIPVPPNNTCKRWCVVGAGCAGGAGGVIGGPFWGGLTGGLAGGIAGIACFDWCDRKYPPKCP